MSTCRRGAPLIMAALLAPPAVAQVRVTTQLLFPVETVYAADFVPFSVGQQPDFLGITLMNGAASQQSVVLELIVRQERPFSRLLFEGSTDPFELRGSVRRITNKDLASQNSDVSIRNYDIASAVEDLQRRSRGRGASHRAHTSSKRASRCREGFCSMSTRYASTW